MRIQQHILTRVVLPACGPRNLVFHEPSDGRGRTAACVCVTGHRELAMLGWGRDHEDLRPAHAGALYVGGADVRRPAPSRGAWTACVSGTVAGVWDAGACSLVAFWLAPESREQTILACLEPADTFGVGRGGCLQVQCSSPLEEDNWTTYVLPWAYGCCICKLLNN